MTMPSSFSPPPPDPAEAARAAIQQARTRTFTIAGVGDFVLHRPTVGDFIAIGKRYSQLAGGQTIIDADAQALLRAQAILETIADVKPAGFKFENCEDPRVFFDFLMAYADWLRSFLPDTTTDTGA